MVPSAESYGVPIMENDVSDSDWKSELADADLDNEMSFTKDKLHPIRLTKAIKYSRELKNLSRLAFGDWIVSRLKYKLGITMEKAFLTGPDHSNQPLGIFTTDDQGVPSSRDVSEGNGTSQIKADGLINALYNLKSGYIRSKSCRWIFHRDALKQIRKLKDGEGNYLWQPGLGEDRPPMILGVPYLLSEYAPSAADFVSGARVGAVCDLKYYGIAQSQEIGVQILDQKYALENADAAIVVVHVDGMPLIPEAFSMVTLA
jgi:HK97 family phage major capsid protein